jgi:hypothetical protein
MTDATTSPTAADETRRVLFFHEALCWIANKNLAGYSLGPIPLDVDRDKADEEAWKQGLARYHFAKDLLLNNVAKGNIRIYSGHDVNPIDRDFIARAKLGDENDEYCLWWLSADEEDGENYDDLAVDYADLVAQFSWNEANTAPSTDLPQMLPWPSMPSNNVSAPRPMSRRGRKAKYKWAELTAKVVEYCLDAPFYEQRFLTHLIKEWCNKNWQELPDDSDLNAYVAPIFEKFDRHWRANGVIR